MTAEIEPGQWISVKVTAEPEAAAPIKTMVRLFERDQAMKAERKRLARSRPVRTHRRGGRPWADRAPRVRVVKTTPGAVYRIFASVDVLRELASLDRYVEITPA